MLLYHKMLNQELKENVVVQSLSCVQLFLTSWTAARQAPLSSSDSQSLLKFLSIESVMLSNHLILYWSLLLLLSVFPSIRVFSNVSGLCIRWPEYWSFSISPSKGFPGLISFRMDWFDSLLSKELSRIFSSTTVRKHQFFGMHSAFFMAQLSHLYMTTWKIIALIIWIFVSKVKSLLFNMLSRFVKVFLPKSNFMVAVTVCSDI